MKLKCESSYKIRVALISNGTIHFVILFVTCLYSPRMGLNMVSKRWLSKSI